VTGGGALRLVLDDAGPAAWNMAVDEALLCAAEVPSLRLYGWRPHAVSLGWFQRAADFDDLPPGTPIVRRLTGGGAIWHGDEITFALALDAGLLPADVGASYRLLHDAAVRALAAFGVACERLDAGDPQHSRPTERWCFRAPGRDDVVTARGKLLGSAQRRVRVPRPRVLHHGSLVLERPDATPFVAAVADAGIAPDRRADLRRRLADELAATLGLRPVVGTLTEDERRLAEELRPRYEDAAFVRSR